MAGVWRDGVICGKRKTRGRIVGETVMSNDLFKSKGDKVWRSLGLCCESGNKSVIYLGNINIIFCNKTKLGR